MSSVLEWLKSQSKVESVLLMARDEEAKRVMVAWTLYRPKFKDVDTNAVTLEKALSWLWTEEIDYERLAGLADVKRKRCVVIFARLRESLLVFPDGTLSTNASAVITAEAAGWLKPLLLKK